MPLTKCKNTIFPLLLFLFAFCNGQSTIQYPNEGITEQLTFTSKNKKLKKTQGTTEHQNIHCSLQDKMGNLWFGTTGEGVYRYDGKEFTQFTKKDGLSNNSVWYILEDQSGYIWFGTDDGVSRYDGKTIKKIPLADLPSFSSDNLNTHQSKNSVWSIFQDRSGIIWFGTSQDLYCYDGKKFSRFLDRDNILNNQNLQLKWIQCILEDSHGKIWFGSGPIANEGVIRFDGKSITASKPNGDGWIRHIVKDDNGYIWFSGRQNGVFKFDGQSFKTFKEKQNIGSAILKDNNGNIWFDGGEKNNTIESIDGIWRYDGKTFMNFSSSHGMGKYSVWSILEDSNGNIWIGTRNCELFRYDGKRFIAFSE